MIRIQPNQTGVTLVELMIATVIFSVVLVLIMAAFLFVSNDYIRGYVQSQTQETARSIMQQVVQDIQVKSSGTIPPLTPVNGIQAYCIGDHRYSFKLDNEIGAAGALPDSLVADTQATCAASAPQDISLASNLSTTSKELLGKHMRLGAFTINQVAHTTGSYTVTLEIVYGDDSSTGGPVNKFGASPGPYMYSCPRISIGGQFCAISNLTATVQQRE